MHQLRKHTSDLTKKIFMAKELDQAIRVRSKLRNKLLDLKTEESTLAYAKQRNYCV